MYEEVKTWLAAIEAAEQQYEAALEGLRSGLEHTDGPAGACPACEAGEAVREQRDAAWNARADAEVATWNALKASTDPLVRWIAEHCAGHRNAAQVILEALPAPMSVLDGIASEQGWCWEWDELRKSAYAAGVLPKDAEVPA